MSVQAPDLALYVSSTCMYCRRVQRVLRALDAEVELRNVAHPEHRSALLAARGRGTVPVLRIEEETGVRWMPESADINRFLADRFGDGTVPAPTLFERIAEPWVLALIVGLLVAFGSALGWF